jgi:hypothetical protein
LADSPSVFPARAPKGRCRPLTPRPVPGLPDGVRYLQQVGPPRMAPPRRLACAGKDLLWPPGE